MWSPVKPEEIFAAENRESEQRLVNRYQNEQLANRVLGKARTKLGAVMQIIGWTPKGKTIRDKVS